MPCHRQRLAAAEPPEVTADQVLDELQGRAVGGRGTQQQRIAAGAHRALPAGERDRPFGLGPFHLHLFGRDRAWMITLVAAGPVPRQPALAGAEVPAPVAEVLAELSEV